MCIGMRVERFAFMQIEMKAERFVYIWIDMRAEIPVCMWIDTRNERLLLCIVCVLWCAGYWGTH